MKKRVSEASALAARLQETHSLMSSGKDQMLEISSALTSTSDKYRSTADVYGEYGSVFGASKRLIAEIARRVTWQDFVWYLGFYLFLATCAYIVLERFPVGTIVSPVWRLLSFCLQQAHSALEVVWPGEPKLDL